jgi:hypothetical protein
VGKNKVGKIFEFSNLFEVVVHIMLRDELTQMTSHKKVRYGRSSVSCLWLQQQQHDFEDPFLKELCIVHKLVGDIII